jgi:hypothetical protein
VCKKENKVQNRDEVYFVTDIPSDKFLHSAFDTSVVQWGDCFVYLAPKTFSGTAL